MSTKAPCPCRRIRPGRSLQKSLSSRSCRGAWTGQHSSSCVSAMVLILGGSDDMGVDEQDREQIDNERERVEERDQEDNTKTSNARSNM